jgi:hypothetical protein
LTAKEALAAAVSGSKRLRKLAPNVPVTRKARTVEYLARWWRRLPKSSLLRAPVLDALLDSVRPLVCRTYKRSNLGRLGVMEADWYQEAMASLINMTQRYYDPHRGPYLVMVYKVLVQLATNLARRTDARESKILRFRDGLGCEEDGDGTKAPPTVPDNTECLDNQGPCCVERFCLFYAANPANPDVLRLARLIAVLGTVPSVDAVAQLYRLTLADAARLKDNTLISIRDFLVLYEGYPNG